MPASAITSISRLSVFLILCASLLVFVTVPGAVAQSNPIAFAQELGDTAIADLTDPSLPNRERVKRMRKLLDSAFDAEAISKFVLGRYSQRASEDQFREFVDLYKIYVAHNYAGLFKRYNGEKIDMRNAREVGDGDQIVSGVIRQPDGPPINIDLRLRPTDGSFKAVDLKVEGVSMPLTHRKQFVSVISQRGGKVEGLLEALRGAVDKFEKTAPSQ